MPSSSLSKEKRGFVPGATSRLRVVLTGISIILFPGEAHTSKYTGPHEALVIADVETVLQDTRGIETIDDHVVEKAPPGETYLRMQWHLAPEKDMTLVQLRRVVVVSFDNGGWYNLPEASVPVILYAHVPTQTGHPGTRAALRLTFTGISVRNCMGYIGIMVTPRWTEEDSTLGLVNGPPWPFQLLSQPTVEQLANARILETTERWRRTGQGDVGLLPGFDTVPSDVEKELRRGGHTFRKYAGGANRSGRCRTGHHVLPGLTVVVTKPGKPLDKTLRVPLLDLHDYQFHQKPVSPGLLKSVQALLP